VRTSYTERDAVTVEHRRTPIEQQMSGVENMALHASRPTPMMERSSLQVTFDIDSNTDIDQVNTQNKVAQAQPFLPQNVATYGSPPAVRRSSAARESRSIRQSKATNPLFISNYGTINLTDGLYRVPGVGQIAQFGAVGTMRCRIWVRPDKLAKLGLTVSDLANAIQAQNNVKPIGSPGRRPPIPPGQQFTYTVRAQGRPPQSGGIRQHRVRLNTDGSTVRLNDVARI